MDLISEVYYSPQGYMSQSKLYDTMKRKGEPYSSVKQSDIKKWFEQQQIYQQNKQPSKIKNYVHYDVKESNGLHQADLVEMPTDHGYKYLLTLIDVYSRYAAGYCLKKKDGPSVLKAVQDIYKHDPFLDYPKKMVTDSGKEFKNNAFKEMIGNIEYVTPGDMCAKSIIERFNKTFELPLFRRMQVQESKTNRVSKKWIQPVIEMISAYNGRTHSTIRIIVRQKENLEIKVKTGS